MASAEIAFVCGLKVRVGHHDRLYKNSDADETLTYWERRYVRKCYLTVVKKDNNTYSYCKGVGRKFFRRGNKNRTRIND